MVKKRRLGSIPWYYLVNIVQRKATMLEIEARHVMLSLPKRMVYLAIILVAPLLILG